MSLYANNGWEWFISMVIVCGGMWLFMNIEHALTFGRYAKKHPTDAKHVLDKDAQVHECHRCNLRKNCVPVPGRGNRTRYHSAMIVGEAPGKDECHAGKPFVGLSGKNLDEALGQCGLQVAPPSWTTNQCWLQPVDFYITNAVKCLPLANNGNIRPPDTAEIKACREHLLEEIYDVKPEVVLMLGKVSIMQCLNLTERDVERVIENAGKVTLKDNRLYIWGTHPSPNNMSRSDRKEALYKACKVLKAILDDINEGKDPTYIYSNNKSIEKKIL